MSATNDYIEETQSGPSEHTSEGVPPPRVDLPSIPTLPDVSGDVRDVAGDVAGDDVGDVAGDVAGDDVGDVAGDVAGDFAGDFTGDVGEAVPMDEDADGSETPRKPRIPKRANILSPSTDKDLPQAQRQRRTSSARPPVRVL